MAGTKQQRAFVLAHEILDPDQPGARCFEFPTAQGLADAFGLATCPESVINRDWITWDQAATTAVARALPGDNPVSTSAYQLGEDRGGDLAYHVQVAPAPQLLDVGAIYNNRWFRRLTRTQKATIAEWLLTKDLVLGRDAIDEKLRLNPLRVVRDLRVMERTGVILAMTNEAGKPGQKFVGNAPPDVFQVLLETKRYAIRGRQ
mgnify:CR=1 FL=1